MCLMGKEDSKGDCTCLEEIVAGEGGPPDFGGEEICFEHVSLLHGVGNVDFPTAIMFRRGANIPADNTVFAEGSACIRSKVGHDASARGSDGGSIKVVVSKHGCMSG